MPEDGVEQSQIPLQKDRTGILVRRSVPGVVRRLFSWWRRQPTPEVKQAATIFHLERHKVACPKLLAFGEDAARWRRNSFVLMESVPVRTRLSEVVSPSAPDNDRRIWLRRAGEFMRTIHESGYILGRQAADASAFGVLPSGNEIALTRLDELERRPGEWPRLAILDLPKLAWLSGLGHTDKMRFIHGYLRIRRLNREGCALVSRLFARLPREAAR